MYFVVADTNDCSTYFNEFGSRIYNMYVISFFLNRSSINVDEFAVILLKFLFGYKCMQYLFLKQLLGSYSSMLDYLRLHMTCC